ncbi:hypothetical protein NCCP2716_27380 [Sporosarcina sp. NCCP-2716]|uniref:hypothetical protein n=1 Tax=Sporosarcina sp. NCCP-2716 TaxID=2943679 RepID=UPI00203EFC45|nr:hypothetical protein [Sporosarcina sp. NCCP-2716]GKV70240.1 hypothetical protein NCCP2716_27380 [Sporosarcina sp. NCCP-2716]
MNNLNEIYQDLRDPEGNIHDDFATLRRSFALCAKLIKNTATVEDFQKLVDDYQDAERALHAEMRRRRACKPKS